MYAATSSPNSQWSRKVLSFLLARYGFTTASKKARSFFHKKKFNSWQANFEYSVRFSASFSFGQVRMNENSASFGSCESVE